MQNMHVFSSKHEHKIKDQNTVTVIVIQAKQIERENAILVKVAHEQFVKE